MKKLIMMLLLIGFGYSQSLPQPAVVGKDVEFPTLRISQFVKVDETIGVIDERVTMGIKQLLQNFSLQVILHMNLIITNQFPQMF